MKIEELEGLEFPFKVRITNGKGWYTDKEGESFEIFDICKRDVIGSNEFVLYPVMRDKIKVLELLELCENYRNNLCIIQLKHCELVKEPTYQDLKEAYANLTEEDLSKAVFKFSTEAKVRKIIDEYGFVWGKFGGMGYELDGKFVRSSYIYDNECVEFMCFPFHDNNMRLLQEIYQNSVGYFVELDAHVEYTFQVFHPENSTNAKILENKIDPQLHTEIDAHIIATEEIELFN